MNFLKKKKTYILAGLLATHGLVMFLAGDQTFGQFISGSQELMEVFGGGAMAAGRAAVSNG